MLIVDGHEDLAYNALVDGRNYLRSAWETQAAEAGAPTPGPNGICMLGLPEWLEAGVAVVIATITAIPASDALPGEPGYRTLEEAFSIANAQMEIYERWCLESPRLRIVRSRADLDDVLHSWAASGPGEPDRRQVGLALLIENADVVREPDEVGYWYGRGVRAIGPAWHSNRYTASSRDLGPLTPWGRTLLRNMDDLGMVLDLSHMADEACRQALDAYAGPIVASHANPRHIVPMFRMLSDDTIRSLAARGGMVGIMPLNWALDPTRSLSRAELTLDLVVDAIDVICELAGNCHHVGIGSDFDGGQGAESAPAELETVADLPRLAEALARRGYRAEDISNIMGGNWIRFLHGSLPDS
jgi:membrane dipeptidase